ncbi:MAG: hypothetical protein KF914_08400 [Rhizobiaceae bacterium]|nr:hypothetical protein [Rhizobiaceae bacterium]
MSEVSAGEQFGGLTKTGWFYRGTVIASDPSVLSEGGRFDLFYTDLDTGKGRTVIARATSPDGRNWETRGETDGIRGLVMQGRSGDWDENAESASIVRRDGKWTLFFSGYRDAGEPYRGFPAALWVATSADGQTFERVSTDPVMTPTKGWYDNDAIYSATVIYDGGAYHMAYVGHSYTDFSKIGQGGVYLLSATSADGIAWKKAADPVARPGQFDDWRRDGIAEPYLVKVKRGQYLLFYTGLDGEARAIGVATGPSPDGPWDFGSQPIVRPGKKGAPDEHQVLAPAAVLDGDRLRLWYLAASKDEMLSIGEAEGSLNDVLAASGH